jgi:protoporphyrinogen oxidase
MAAIVVVGGGVAGLVCAWRLRRAGHDVDVLEQRDAPGGHRVGVRHEGFLLEPLSPWLSSGERNLASIARGLGLADALRPIARSDAAFFAAGEIERIDVTRPLSLASGPELGWTDRARLLRLLATTRHQASATSAFDPERLAAGDDGSIAAGLRRAVGVGPGAARIEALLEAVLGVDSDEVSRPLGWNTLGALARPGARVRLEGGVGALVDALAENAPVRLGCTVVSVETESGGARVRYRARGRSRSVLSDAVVVATPFVEIAALCPKLTPDERGFFQESGRVDTVTVHLLFDRAPRGLPGFFVFPHREGRMLEGLAVAHHEPGIAPAGAGVLSARLTRAAAQRTGPLADAEVAQIAFEALSETPVARRMPDDVVIQRTSYDASSTAPSGLRRVARFRSRLDRSPRLVFAGGAAGLDLEAEVSEGMRAATAIIGSIQRATR